jgi:hypothetical protein
MLAKVSLALFKLPDAQLIIQTDKIIGNMTGNAAYPTPTPSLASVQTASTAFQNALAEAADGGKMKTAEKNAARVVLVDKLRALSLYVQMNCENDLATLLSSGYDATKPPTPVGILPAPEGVTLTQGKMSGALDLQGAPVSRAAGYEGQITQNLGSTSDWTGVGIFTAARMTAQGLSPGTNYWGRMRAIGSAGPGAWSDPVPAIAI